MWERFYTPQNVARKMINIIPELQKPNIIADICVGSGNLLKEANKRWPRSKLLALDVDRKAINKFKRASKNVITKCCDATNFKDISNLLKQHELINNCDILVANPPFGYYHNNNISDDRINYLYKPIIKSLLEEARKLNRIEAFMLISNVILLRPGGILASIIPENVFTSEKWKMYKKIFIKYLFDEVYISKTDRFFKKSEVKTRIFVGRLKKRFSPWKITKNRIHSKYIVNNFQILRGTFIPKSTKLKVANKNVPIFHSDCLKFLKQKKQIVPTRRIAKDNRKYKSNAILRSNDIVIIRAGRNCGTTAVIKNLYKGWHVSDCIYVLRHPNNQLHSLSNALEKKLTKMQRGLTVKYITKKDVLKALTKLV